MPEGAAKGAWASAVKSAYPAVRSPRSRGSGRRGERPPVAPLGGWRVAGDAELKQDMRAGRRGACPSGSGCTGSGISLPGRAGRCPPGCGAEAISRRGGRSRGRRIRTTRLALAERPPPLGFCSGEKDWEGDEDPDAGSAAGTNSRASFSAFPAKAGTQGCETERDPQSPHEPRPLRLWLASIFLLRCKAASLPERRAAE